MEVIVVNTFKMFVLDICTNLFVSAIVLQSAFAIVRSMPPESQGGESIIDAQFDCVNLGHQFNVVVTSPEGLRFEPELADIGSIGRFLIGADTELVVIGCSRFGDLHAQEEAAKADQAGAGAPAKKSFRVLVLRPTPGNWKVDARFANVVDPSVFAAATAPLTTDLTRHIRGRRVASSTQNVPLVFSKTSAFEDIIVKRAGP